MYLKKDIYNSMWSSKQYAGSFVVLCGFDGSGKTTQVQEISRYWAQEKHIIQTFQPSHWYRNNQEVRDYLESGKSIDPLLLALLAATDRRKHTLEIIEPSLTSSQNFIISDRYVYSSLAYFYARGLSLESVIKLNQFIPRPCITFYLHLPPTAIIERLQKRDGLALKYEEKLSFIEKVYEVYQLLSEIDERFIVIDGTASISSIHNQVRYHIDKACFNDK
ncbi:dTMP kinase [Bartonella tribocorum]|uniref:Thymidylate kinase n=1 Tax=Bartonella tribocorum (strain DSM 28219 / CCUG 45778 / CIP 105476 / IBS 506) TaxID=382640 RepID=A9IQG1_BART1|nr:dTMP kinase [Bartonella tribocorum]CAK01053.1 putative thymidylate kinase [Bartonella tribocorum CIP 105476]CDO48265.1 thymidylate kinase [Bartonella tribocorum]